MERVVLSSRRGASALLALLLANACSSSVARSAQSTGHATVCAVDETREYYCDDLLPLNSSLPAPSPYQSCPDGIDDPVSEYDVSPAIGLFDVSYTEYTRKRAPPGHSCCYSWCSRITLADPSAPSARTACQQATAFREEYCMGEPETGTSESVGEPFAKCPAAIVPPAKSVFSKPDAALFDAQLTTARRAKGQADCCYAWCSQAPPGSDLVHQTH